MGVIVERIWIKVGGRTAALHSSSHLQPACSSPRRIIAKGQHLHNDWMFHRHKCYSSVMVINLLSLKGMTSGIRTAAVEPFMDLKIAGILLLGP